MEFIGKMGRMLQVRLVAAWERRDAAHQGQCIE